MCQKNIVMEDRINILNELKQAGADTLLKIGNKNHFFVPNDYFNNFSSDLMSGIFINTLPLSNPYTVPPLYFKNLEEMISERIYFIKNISNSGVNQKNVYVVPEGYFDGFAGNILNKIKNTSATTVQQELKEISPLLSSIPKTNIYTLPGDYLSNFTVTKTTNTTKIETKIIPLKRKVSKWVSYVAAASIAIIICGSGIIYFLDNHKNYSAENTQAFTEDTNVQSKLSELSDDEITNYLEVNTNMGVYNNYGSEEQSQNLDIQSMLKNVSDEEIQQYLKKEEPEAYGKEEGI